MVCVRLDDLQDPLPHTDAKGARQLRRIRTDEVTTTLWNFVIHMFVSAIASLKLIGLGA